MAHPGDLDTSFGSGGKKTVNFGGTDAGAASCSCSPTGGSSPPGGGGPASSFCVVRLRAANGTLDPTFGAGGKRVIDFGTDDESVYGAALQPDGKIVLAGDSRLQVAVVRLKANGALDTTFDGDGRKMISWGAIGRATAVVVAPNGKLLIGGFSGPEGGNIQVARLKANGALDTTFATAGIATIDFGGDDFGEALARQADGRIVVAGRSTAAGAVVARLRATAVSTRTLDSGGASCSRGGSARAAPGPSRTARSSSRATRASAR